MADEAKKKKPGETFYSVRTLNKWFLYSSLAMAIAYVWSVVEDHRKPWKQIQRQFLDLEWYTATGQAAEEWDESNNRELSELFTRLDDARAQIGGDSVERPKLEKALGEADLKARVAKAAMKSAKAQWEAERFHYEEHAYHADEPDMWNPQSDAIKEELAHYLDLKTEFETLDEESKAADEELAAVQARLDDYDRLVSSVQTEIDSLEREVGRLERLRDGVDTERPFTTFRNSIFFDFMQPNIKVRKIVAHELLQELNFLQMPRIDMCISCHLGSDRHQDYPSDNPPWFMRPADDPEGEVDPAERVFLAHSRPELFCTSLSPHGQERFGCTGCHQGNGQRLDFGLTFHAPSDAAEAERWEEDYHWHEPHYWDYPMLSSRFIESSCYKCHTDEVEIPGADTWNRGRELVESYGCFGCHTMAPFEGYRKTGPPLYHILSKFSSPEWAMKWVENPRGFRPSTRMPQFFHLENKTSDPVRQNAEIVALVSYLYNLSTPLDLKPYPGNGDAERGKNLFGENGGVGCLACHGIDDYPSEEYSSYDRHGPDLSAVGSKLSEDWLYNWLLDPTSIWAETNMPNLRLTEQEAADLVAYLMTKRHGAFEGATFDRPDGDAVYEQILVEKFTERMTEERAREEVGAMSSLNKRLLAGEYLVSHHGCFGCHNISGYEETKPIGTELNGWGSKHPDRLDFGVFDMDWKKEGKFSREAWLEKKLTNTRYFDRGKDRKPFEQLKMPQFRFAESDDEHKANMEAVMNFVLSLSKDHVRESIKRHLTPAESAVQRGEKLVRQKNCYGCHMMYDMGGEIRSFIGTEDGATAFHPPLLDGQGARTKHEWLFSFLADPSMGEGRGSKAHLRPWMQARMPTFNFSQQQLNDLIAYFAHQEVWHTAEDRDLWDQVVAEFREAFTGYDDYDLRTGSGAKKRLFMALIARKYKAMGGTFLYQTDFPYLADVPEELDNEMGAVAKEFFGNLKCASCHQPGGNPPPGKTAADMAPSLDLTRDRLQPKWVKNWFMGPASYQPGTRMPNLWPEEDGVRDTNHPEIQDADLEMELIRDYLFSNRFQTDYKDFTITGGQ